MTLPIGADPLRNEGMRDMARLQVTVSIHCTAWCVHKALITVRSASAVPQSVGFTLCPHPDWQDVLWVDVVSFSAEHVLLVSTCHSLSSILLKHAHRH